jgi:TP901 family phage tail tape measure protein
MSALRELFAVFRIEVDHKELKEATEHVEGFKNTLKKVGNVLAEAFAIDQIKEFVEGQVEAGAQLKVMADRLGTDTDELQAYQLAAGEAGVSTEALTTGLRFLNRNIAEASKGGGEGAAIFRELGISLKNGDGTTRSSADVMGDLADSIAEIPDTAKKTEVAMKLLGRGGAELIPLLNRGGEAFEEARKSMQELGGGMSKEFVEQAHEAEAANVRLEFSLKGLKSQIASALLPILGDIVKTLTHVVSGAIEFNKETNALTTAVAFFGTIGAVKALGSLKELMKVFGLLKPTVGETIISLLGFAAPLLLLGLLYLIFDDLYTLMTGGESVIGDTIDDLFGIGTAAQFAKDLSEALSALPDILTSVGKILWNVLVTPFEQIFDTLKGVGNVLGDLAGGNFALAKKELTDQKSDFGKRMHNIGAAGEGLGDDLTLSKKARAFKRGETPFVGPMPAPAIIPKTNIYGTPIGEGTGGTAIHQTNTTSVVVHTGSDQPKAVGDAVGQGVSTAQERNNHKARTALRKP